MNRGFQRIDDLVKDLYGVRLMQQPISPHLARIRELQNAYDTMMKIIEEKRNPLISEFLQHVYPLWELAFQWDELRKKGKLATKFRRKCRDRVKTEHNFYGTIFEIDMAAGCLMKGWGITFVEECVKEGKRIDFLFHDKRKPQAVGGVECLSKRYAERYAKGGITIEMLNRDIKDKARKFEDEYVKNLPSPLDVRLLLIDLTRADYSVPPLVGILDNRIELSDRLDAVVFTWTEQTPPRLTARINRKIRRHCQVIGNAKGKWLPDSYETQVFESPFGMGSVRACGITPYVYPPPTIRVGQAETLEEYLKKSKKEL
jgi:hypothetical protein